MISQFIRSAVLRRRLGAGLIVLLSICSMLAFVGVPAFQARLTLDELQHAEQTDGCERDAARGPGGSPPAQAAQQKEAEPQTADGDQRRERADHAAPSSDCVPKRANLIAIEALRSSNAATFVALVVGVASILGVGAAVIGVREAGRERSARFALAPSFVSSGPDVGELVLENVGPDPLWLASVRVDDAVRRAGSAAGLLRLDGGGSASIGLDLAAADHRCAAVHAEHQDAYGRRWRLEADLCHMAGEWRVARLENRPQH